MARSYTIQEMRRNSDTEKWTTVYTWNLLEQDLIVNGESVTMQSAVKDATARMASAKLHPGEQSTVVIIENREGHHNIVWRDGSPVNPPEYADIYPHN